MFSMSAIAGIAGGSDGDGSQTVSAEESRTRLQPLGRVGQELNILLGNTLITIDRDRQITTSELCDFNEHIEWRIAAAAAARVRAKMLSGPC
jgi:hypothetical protein